MAAASNTPVKRGVSDLVVEPRIHVSGLAANLEELTQQQRELVEEFRANMATSPVAQANRDYLCDAVYVRFLIARDWDIQKATKMILAALAWRIKRPSHRWCLANDSGRAETFKVSSSSGKIRVSGVDRHGRPVMVFDNTKENITDTNQMMEFLAWNMELCMRTARAPADKIMLFMHMTEFSLFNQPPMSVTTETLTILSTAFPESLGTCVVFNAPAYFRVFWSGISRFIDPKTASKVFLLSGDISSGSSNDEVMKKIVGTQWKELTGAGKPSLTKPFSPKAKKHIDASPGFDVETYWPTVMSRETSWAGKLEQLPPPSTSPPSSPSTQEPRRKGPKWWKSSPRKGITKGIERASIAALRKRSPETPTRPVFQQSAATVGLGDTKEAAEDVKEKKYGFWFTAAVLVAIFAAVLAFRLTTWPRVDHG